MSRPKGVWILYVPGVGFEPTCPFGPVLLRHLRIPFRHPGLNRIAGDTDVATPVCRGLRVAVGAEDT